MAGLSSRFLVGSEGTCVGCNSIIFIHLNIKISHLGLQIVCDENYYLGTN